MQKKEQKPDRVYGLRMTNRLERLLKRTEDKRAVAEGKMIGETIKSTPFRPGGDPLVFPFLALEAKSEKGKDSFSDIETQTAFVIRSLLELQEDLRRAAGEDSEWESGPLVWFLANKGEQWRVAAAYIEYQNGVRHYVSITLLCIEFTANNDQRIVDLWNGRIISTDGALQLLLIVDYIFDWARDIYREAIVEELRSLAATNSTSLGNDSNVFSLDDRIAFLPELPPTQELSEDEDNDSTNPNQITEISNQDYLRAFDSPTGVLRDVSYIRSRFLALHITEDNLSVLMKSMTTPEKAQETAENILRCLRDSWRVTREAIDTIELKWTGKDRENMSLYSPKKVFFVTVTVSAYLSPDWEQTRELCCLAVSEGVLEQLFQRANLKNNGHSPSLDSPWVNDDTFVPMFQAYLTMSMKDNLFAAISRACVSTKIFTRPAKTAPRNVYYVVESAERIPDAIKYRLDAAVMPDSHAYARGLVSSIYNLHKIGRNEPSSSILRISTRLDKQIRMQKSIPECLWPFPQSSATSDDQQQAIIFVTSKNRGNVPQYAELCLFLVDMSRIDDIINQNSLEEFSTACTFQASRMDTKPGWGAGWNRTDVQMNDTDFLDDKTKFLSHLSGLESFAKYTKGKAVERSAPARVWKPRKNHSNYVMAMAQPQSFLDVLDFQSRMATRGRRVSSVTELDRSFSQAELLKLAMKGPGIQEDEASGTSETPSVPDSITNNLPGRLQNTSDQDKSYSTGTVSKLHMDKTDKSREINIGSRKGKSVDRRAKSHEREDNERLTDRDKGNNASVSSSEKLPTLVLRNRVPKRHFDDSDMGIGSSSQVSPKRPRESRPQFDNDYLDDEELSFLLENGCFAN